MASALHSSHPASPRNQVTLIGLAAITVIFAYLTVYAFTEMVARDYYFSRAGFYALPAIPEVFLAAIIGIGIPLFWLPRRIVVASDICIHYLYFFVLVPSCVLLPYRSTLSAEQQIWNIITLVAAFALLEARRVLPQSIEWRIPLQSATVYLRLLIAATVIFFVIIFSTNTLSLENINFFEVYEQRRQFLNDESIARLITGYAGNWAAVALAPIISIYALERRQYLLSLFGPAIAFTAFAATSFKSQIFVPLVVIVIYFAMVVLKEQSRAYVVGLFALGLSVASIAIDLFWTKDLIITWATQFRFVGNNGFLTAQYVNFFTEKPKGYYADSIGRLFFESYYNVPISQAVGESFSPVVGNHANANLWADGFGNLGTLGIFVASAELVVFMWVVDSGTRGRSAILVAPAMISACFALANTSVHSMLSSNGGWLLIALLAAMPTHRVVERQFKFRQREVVLPQ